MLSWEPDALLRRPSAWRRATVAAYSSHSSSDPPPPPFSTERWNQTPNTLTSRFAYPRPTQHQDNVQGRCRDRPEEGSRTVGGRTTQGG